MDTGNERRVKIAVIALGIASVTLIVPLVLLYQGLVVSQTELNPQSPAEGTECNLFAATRASSPALNPVVRCAAVVSLPAEKLWKSVTDYSSFPQIFSGRVWSIVDVQAAPQNDSLVKLSAKIRTPIGDYPLGDEMHHQVDGGKYSVNWDSVSESIPVNRGSWEISELGPASSRIVYSLDLKIANYPVFLSRNVLLAGVPLVIDRLVEHARTNAP